MTECIREFPWVTLVAFVTMILALLNLTLVAFRWMTKGDE